MFYPVRPMLAGKPMSASSGWDLSSWIRNKERVVVETKYDGERLQCHLQDKVIKFFSRNGHNVTAIYGPSMSPQIIKSISATAAILDGEIVVYDRHIGQMAPFGLNKEVASRNAHLGPEIDEDSEGKNGSGDGSRRY